jgi:hypothetical protein
MGSLALLTAGGLISISGIVASWLGLGQYGSSSSAFDDTSGMAVVTETKEAAPTEESCIRGEATACMAVAVLYAAGDGVEQDEAKSFALYERACELGSVAGCVATAIALAEGRGVAPNESRATHLFRRACAEGDLLACRRTSGGVGLLENSCKWGEGPACNSLAGLFERGEEVPRNEAKAFDLYERACAAAYVPACYRAAMFLYHGQGTRKDPMRATELFRHACRAGEASACRKWKELDLGLLPETPAGGTPAPEAPAPGAPPQEMPAPKPAESP